jgi:hypothetical protein
MGDLWQEHRRFIVSVAAGALIFLIASMIISSTFGGRITAFRRSIAESRNTMKNAPKGTELRALQADREAAEALRDTLVAELERKPAEGLRVGPDRSDPDGFYSRAIQNQHSLWTEHFASRNIDLDDTLGRPDSFPTLRYAQDWYLRGLDAVTQVLAIASIADDRFPGSIVAVEKIDIAAAPKLTGRSAHREGDPFLTRLPVTITILGHPKGVDEILRRLAVRRTDGRTLVLEKGKIESQDRMVAPGTQPPRGLDERLRGLVRAVVVLQALDVEPEGRIDRGARRTGS